MHEFVEPQVRRLVAEHLGVGVEDLVSEVSLRDDLAADSLDLIELAMVLEGEFAIVVPERILDAVRTYSDLVHATGLLIRARCAAEARGAEPPERIWARIVPAAGKSGGTLERTGWLTPYTAETIVEDAVRAGRGARLELTVATRTTEGLVRAQRQFARLGTRGVQVTVRRDDRPAASPAHSSADGVAERHQVAAADSHLALSHQLLDQLTGTRTTVTITGYVGDDPWQADDLIACVGQPAKRFGDGTPAEQGQALSDRGPAHFVEGDPLGGGYRATAGGHHVHVDGPSGEAVDRTREGIRQEPRHLEIGLGRVGDGRYYQTDLSTEVRPSGELLTWQQAAYYSQDQAGRAVDIASSLTRLTPGGHPSDRQQGLRAHFDLCTPSPNAFRPLTVRLAGADERGACTLDIRVSARVAGEDLFAQMTVGGGAEPTLDVCLLPPPPPSEVEGVASP